MSGALDARGVFSLLGTLINVVQDDLFLLPAIDLPSRREEDDVGTWADANFSNRSIDIAYDLNSTKSFGVHNLLGIGLLHV